MTAALVSWVLEHSPYDGGARALHLVLAHHADARRLLSRAQVDLAADVHMDVGHVRRLLRTIADDGLLDVFSPATGQRPAVLQLAVGRDAVERASTRVLERASTRALEADPRGREPFLDLDQVHTPPPPAPRKRARKPKKPGPHDEAARSVVKAVWEGKSPRPAQQFFALVRVAAALLDAGHERDQVELAFFAVPTITVRSCEFWLNGAGRTNGAPRRSGEVGIDRNTPGGRIQL